MGIIYKLKPEVIEFVLEKKKKNTNLSCRKITALIFDKFQLKLSKSSVNSIFKQAGLSLPAGRRAKRKQLVRCIKVTLLDGSSFYLDGQLHTVWHSSGIPEDFTCPIYDIKSYIERVFKENHPFVLFFASGYEAPTQELFEFILSFTLPEKRISQLILYNHKLEELEKIHPSTLLAGDSSQREPSPFSRHFVFGVWPWQFKEYIKVRMTDIAEAEVELSEPKTGQTVKLRGCALNKGTVLCENRPLLLLSNFTPQELSLNELASLYLSHWPNPEEALRNFSRKIEQFRKRFLQMRK